MRHQILAECLQTRDRAWRLSLNACSSQLGHVLLTVWPFLLPDSLLASILMNEASNPGWMPSNTRQSLASKFERLLFTVRSHASNCLAFLTPRFPFSMNSDEWCIKSWLNVLKHETELSIQLWICALHTFDTCSSLIAYRFIFLHCTFPSPIPHLPSPIKNSF